MQEPKRKSNGFQSVIIGCFLGYLAFVQGDFNGNSLLIAVVGIGCIVYGLFQLRPIRKYMMKQMGIVEIDLDDTSNSKTKDKA